MSSSGVVNFTSAIVSRTIGSRWTLLITQAVCCVLLLGIMAFGGFEVSPSGNVLALLMLAGVLNIAGFLALLMGMTRGQISLVAPISSAYGMVAALLSVAFLGEPLTWIHGAGIGLAVLGVALTSVRLDRLRRAQGKMLAAGMGFAFVTLACWGVAVTLVAYCSRQAGWFAPGLIVKSTGFICLLATLLVVRPKTFVRASRSMWLLVVPTGLVDTASYLTLSAGVRSAYASLVAPIAAAAPIITIALARLLIRERLTAVQTAGVALTVGGLVLLAVPW